MLYLDIGFSEINASSGQVNKASVLVALNGDNIVTILDVGITTLNDTIF